MKLSATQYASILYALAVTPFSASALPTEPSTLRERNNGPSYASGIASDKWAKALAEAQAAVAQMTLQEKVSKTQSLSVERLLTVSWP
jgi:hypothetical protein